MLFVFLIFFFFFFLGVEGFYCCSQVMAKPLSFGGQFIPRKEKEETSVWLSIYELEIPRYTNTTTLFFLFECLMSIMYYRPRSKVNAV